MMPITFICLGHLFHLSVLVYPKLYDSYMTNDDEVICKARFPSKAESINYKIQIVKCIVVFLPTISRVGKSERADSDEMKSLNFSECNGVITKTVQLTMPSYTVLFPQWNGWKGWIRRVRSSRAYHIRNTLKSSEYSIIYLSIHHLF